MTELSDAAKKVRDENYPKELTVLGQAVYFEGFDKGYLTAQAEIKDELLRRMDRAKQRIIETKDYIRDDFVVIDALMNEIDAVTELEKVRTAQAEMQSRVEEMRNLVELVEKVFKEKDLRCPNCDDGYVDEECTCFEYLGACNQIRNDLAKHKARGEK